MRFEPPLTLSLSPFVGEGQGEGTLHAVYL